MTRQSRNKGFSLIELLIVISIIVIIIAIIFAVSSTSKAKAADARTKATLSSIRTAATEEKLDASSGFQSVCSSDKVHETISTLAQQLQTNDYNCVSSATDFVIAFPLQATEGHYWCVDAQGSSKEIAQLPSGTPPYTCDGAAGAQNGAGSGTGGSGGGGSGSGGGGGSGGSGGSGSGGGGTQNQPPVISFDAGSLLVGGATQLCSGNYCVVFPETADADFSAFVSATDPEDGSIAVEQSNQQFVYTSDIPTNGPDIGQKTIANIGTFDGCTISSKEVTYTATDSAAATDTDIRTVLFCHEAVTPDTEPPVVTLTAPSSNATLTGAVAISASATDNVAVVGVKFTYGVSVQTATTLIGEEDTDATPPNTYAMSWDTTAVTNGAYVVVATARDVAGNVVSSTSVPVTVSNGPVGPPQRKQLIFSSGFEGTSSTFLNGFDSAQHQYCCSYSLTQSTAIFHEGSASLKADVRKTDPSVSGAWRAEVLPLGVVDEGDRWYGWSIYFDSPRKNGLWDAKYGGAYGYWNPSDNAGTGLLTYQWSNNQWDLSTGPDEISHYGLTPSTPHTSITAGAWHDIVVHANWSTGQLETWLDGASFYNAPAGSLDPRPRYFKFGMAKWGNGAGGKPTDNWVIYYDNLRIGDGATGVGYYDVAPGDY